MTWSCVFVVKSTARSARSSLVSKKVKDGGRSVKNVRIGWIAEASRGRERVRFKGRPSFKGVDTGRAVDGELRPHGRREVVGLWHCHSMVWHASSFVGPSSYRFDMNRRRRLRITCLGQNARNTVLVHELETWYDHTKLIQDYLCIHYLTLYKINIVNPIFI